MMNTWSLAATYTFDAAHWLPDHEGKCRHLHGHTYKVDVVLFSASVLRGPGPARGMVIDFAELDGAVKPLISQLDHDCLNTSLPKGYQPPTAENTAWWLYEQLSGAFPKYPMRVTVWETPTHRASFGDRELP